MNYLKGYMENQVKEIIKNNNLTIIDKAKDDFYPTDKDTETLFSELNQLSLIDFDVMIMEDSSSDCWLQSQFYCKKLGYVIVLDSDFRDSFESIEDIVDRIESINEQIAGINKQITICI